MRKKRKRSRKGFLPPRYTELNSKLMFEDGFTSCGSVQGTFLKPYNSNLRRKFSSISPFSYHLLIQGRQTCHDFMEEEREAQRGQVTYPRSRGC